MLRQGKPWSDEDGRRVGLAMGVARDVLVGMGRAPLGPDIVFVVMERSADIERRQYVRGGPGRVRSLWPDYIHDYDERIEQERQRSINIARDEPIEARIQVRPEELSMMEAINRVFRDCFVGKNVVRDRKILERLARGRKKEGTGREFSLTGQRVAEIKKMHCQAIWKRVKSLLPEHPIVAPFFGPRRGF